jgi:hypothetical protein
MFASMQQRPPAMWNHADTPAVDEELQPPYGIGHVINKTVTHRCRFAIDSMCRPVSAVTSAFVEKMQLQTRKQKIVTNLAAKSAAPVISQLVATCELVVHWNGKRRTFFIEAMVWEDLPDDQDMIISMPDALDTGLIAFNLPHEWRRSWLGTAAFSGKLPLALRQDQSMAAAMHNELIMDVKDEDLIDITQRLDLTKAHICTDPSTLSETQRYWLAEFPELNAPIPEDAHPDLPEFDPPFNAEQMQQYQDKCNSKVPRSSPKMQDKIDDCFKKLSDARIIDLLANPVGVASFVVLVPKPDGSLRICINFSKINKMLLRHHYPLPPCQDLINQLARHKYFAKIDLFNGFYNFSVAKSAQWLTSTIAPGHALTWRKIPQGLAPVPSWFQWAMSAVLGDYVSTICLLYIDDLIIFGDTPDELNANIRKILERLNKYHLRISIKKCDFEPTEEIEFLGHKISYKKISPGSKTTHILRDIVNPNDEREPEDKLSKLNTFIGIVNWFSKYIPDCSRKLKPLLDLRLGDWKWELDQQKCFEMFRELLANIQPLHLPSGGLNRLEVHTDASKFGWFAVLFEDTGVGPPEDRLKVIAYCGGVFRKNQLAWSVLQKEMFAVYQAHLKFDPFIRLHQFRLVVDNKTMTFCETSADMMVQRWYLRIQHYDSEIVHLPGILNVVPDAGSRLLHLTHPNAETAQFCSLSSSVIHSLHPGTYAALKERTSHGDELRTALSVHSVDAVLRSLDDATSSSPCDDASIQQLQLQHTLTAPPTSKSSATIIAFMDGCAADVVSDPDSSRAGSPLPDWATQPMPSHSESCHRSASASTVCLASADTHLSNSMDWATRPMPSDPTPCHGSASASTVALSTAASTHLSQWLRDEYPDAATSHPSVANAVSVTSSAFARQRAEPSTAQRSLPISPEHVHLIRTCHGGASGHHGRDETIRKLQSAGHHWPTRFIDVARYIAACPQCQRFRLKQKLPYAMYKTILTRAPLFGRWHCDYMSVSRPCQFTEATKVFLMEEERSRFVMLHAVKDETAIETVIAFLHTFSIFGIPELVYSDNAQNLVAAATKEFMRITGITHDFSVPHQAHSNGLIERTCGDASRLLRMLCADLHAYGRWSLLLPLVQRCLNSLTRSTIGCSANQLVFGSRVNLDRYILPTAPIAHDDSTRAAAAATDTVQGFLDHLLIAQQDLLHKADQIRVKLLNDQARSRPFLTIRASPRRPACPCSMERLGRAPKSLRCKLHGPLCSRQIRAAQRNCALAHSIVPTPPFEPTTYISTVSDLRLYDDTLAIPEYDVPEDRFRQLAYIDRNTRPVNCILDYRSLDRAVTDPANHVSNFEYQVRFENSKTLTDTAWLPYSSVMHTFAFEAFYSCISRILVGHQCVSIPSAHRQTHQARASAASQHRRRIHRQAHSAASFNVDSLSFQAPA